MSLDGLKMFGATIKEIVTFLNSSYYVQVGSTKIFFGCFFKPIK